MSRDTIINLNQEASVTGQLGETASHARSLAMRDQILSRAGTISETINLEGVTGM